MLKTKVDALLIKMNFGLVGLCLLVGLFKVFGLLIKMVQILTQWIDQTDLIQMDII